MYASRIVYVCVCVCVMECDASRQEATYVSSQFLNQPSALRKAPRGAKMFAEKRHEDKIVRQKTRN